MTMNWSDWLLWGFVSTLVLSTIMSASQGLGWPRMSIPFMLGTLFTPDRDRAQLLGFTVHLLNGLVFSLLYVAAFESWGRAGWGVGALIGLAHALFVLTVGMTLLPGAHRRMASEMHGPSAARLLEPPGFLGLNYGVQTPAWAIVAHVIYGAILGAFYKL